MRLIISSKNKTIQKHNALPNPPNCIQYLDDPPYGALSSLLRSVNVSVLNEESPGNLNIFSYFFITEALKGRSSISCSLEMMIGILFQKILHMVLIQWAHTKIVHDIFAYNHDF